MPSCLQPDNRLGRGVLDYGRSVLIRREKEALLPKALYLTGETLTKIASQA